MLPFIHRVLVVALAASETASPSPGPPEVVSSIVRGNAYEGDQLDTATISPVISVKLVREMSGGTNRLRTSTFDRNGQEFLSQTVTFESGLPSSFSMSSPTAGTSGSLVVTKNELVMDFTDRGRHRTEHKKRPQLFAVGPSVLALIESHISALRSGKEVEFEMVVLNRLDTFSLKLVPIHDDQRRLPQLGDGSWIEIALQPRDPIARLFAPKMVAIVEAASGRTVMFLGPLPTPSGEMGKIGIIKYDRPEAH
jgi:hypothetical protein